MHTYIRIRDVTIWVDAILCIAFQYVTGFAKMCIVHTKILIHFFDPAYSYTQ